MFQFEFPILQTSSFSLQQDIYEMNSLTIVRCVIIVQLFNSNNNPTGTKVKKFTKGIARFICLMIEQFAKF